MSKPQQQTLLYYNWDEVFRYLCEKYGFEDDIDKEEYPEAAVEYYCLRNYLVDTGKITGNGCYFSLDDWEIHNGYGHHVPDFFKPFLEALLDEFGTKTENREDRSVTLHDSW
jgi:hypothetical protein